MGNFKKAFQTKHVTINKDRLKRKKIKAKKAIELAVILLGDDAVKKEVEAQSRDFMQMKMEHIKSSITRWHKTATKQLSKEHMVEKVRQQSIEGYVSAFGARLLDLDDD